MPLILVPWKEYWTRWIHNSLLSEMLGHNQTGCFEHLRERLKQVIWNLVSGYQNTFIKSRQITDTSLIADEVLDWRLKNGVPGLLFKLDIEKAFDKFNWPYMNLYFKAYGFWR